MVTTAKNNKNKFSFNNWFLPIPTSSSICFNKNSSSILNKSLKCSIFLSVSSFWSCSFFILSNKLLLSSSSFFSSIWAFTIFNRGISLDKVTYKNNIRKACHGDLTPFLEFVLKTVKKELEKEAVIYNIKENSQIKLTHEDYEMLEYVFTSKDQTLDEVYSLFCKMNGNKLDKEIWVHRIMPLIEKGIIIFDERNNKIIINKELITLSDDKVKKLSMDKYLI